MGRHMELGADVPSHHKVVTFRNSVTHYTDVDMTVLHTTPYKRWNDNVTCYTDVDMTVSTIGRRYMWVIELQCNRSLVNTKNIISLDQRAKHKREERKGRINSLQRIHGKNRPCKMELKPSIVLLIISSDIIIRF